MKLRKSLVVAGAVATVGLAGITGLGVASAESATTSGKNSAGFVDKLATRFGLNKGEVQKFLDENKEERHAEHQAKYSNYLQQAVDEGKLTAEQKTLIENKLKEVHQQHSAQREELQQWAEDNNIDLRYLKMGGPGQGKLMHP